MAVSKKPTRDFDYYLKESNGWVVFSAPMVPYFSYDAVRTFTDLLYQAYPQVFKVEGAGLIRYTNNGSDSQAALRNDYYLSSAEYFVTHLGLVEKAYRDFVKAEKKYLALVKKFEKGNDEQLHSNYSSFIHAYYSIYVPGAAVDGFLEYEKILSAKMKKKYPRAEKEMDLLFEPYGNPFIKNNQRGLIEIALEAQKRKKTKVKDILQDKVLYPMMEKHQQSFHWIQNSYKVADPLPVSHFSEEVATLSLQNSSTLKEELEKLNKYEKNHRKQCQKIQSQGIFSPNDFEQLQWMGKIAWWLDRRKQYNLMGLYLINRHLRYLCKKHKISYEDAKFLNPPELEKIIQGKKKLSGFSIAERKKDCVHFHDQYGNDAVIVGKSVSKKWETVNPPVKEKGITEFKGTIAVKGKVKGIVRVVRDPKHFGTFNEGDILVTGMTRPDFLGLMKRSGAIVTDEGGMLSHAAIISRELRKPCIIGTKVATKILTDGDRIEVNADKGIVRILGK